MDVITTDYVRIVYIIIYYIIIDFIRIDYIRIYFTTIDYNRCAQTRFDLINCRAQTNFPRLVLSQTTLCETFWVAHRFPNHCKPNRPLTTNRGNRCAKRNVVPYYRSLRSANVTFHQNNGYSVPLPGMLIFFRSRFLVHRYTLLCDLIHGTDDRTFLRS